MIFCHVLIFFKINVFKKNFRNTIKVSISLDPDQLNVLWSLIWVQMVCKGYQEKTLAAKELL